MKITKLQESGMSTFTLKRNGNFPDSTKEFQYKHYRKPSHQYRTEFPQ